MREPADSGLCCWVRTWSSVGEGQQEDNRKAVASLALARIAVRQEPSDRRRESWVRIYLAE